MYGFAAGSRFRTLLFSDNHTDHIESNLSLQKQHMQEAQRDNAPIFAGGDTHCVMQSRNDKRRSPSALRPELQGENYVDKVHKFVSDFYMPFRKNIVMFGQGNHDTALVKYLETDLVARLVEKLNSQGDANVIAGDYYNWIQFRFHFKRGNSCSKNLLQHHGGGGDAPMSLGIIESQRMSMDFPDADAIWLGHNHNCYAIPTGRKRLTRDGVERDSTLLHIRTPSYKDEHKSHNGYAVEKNRRVKPRGCVWLEFVCKPGQAEITEVSMHGIADV